MPPVIMWPSESAGVSDAGGESLRLDSRHETLLAELVKGGVSTG